MPDGVVDADNTEFPMQVIEHAGYRNVIKGPRLLGSVIEFHTGFSYEIDGIWVGHFETLDDAVRALAEATQ